MCRMRSLLCAELKERDLVAAYRQNQKNEMPRMRQGIMAKEGFDKKEVERILQYGIDKGLS